MKLSEFQSVSVIVTVVVFHTLEVVTLAIQFPVSQVSPLGIPKFNTAALLVQLLVTVALLQAGNVVVFQTDIVAALQVAQVSPLGIVKSNTALVVVPLFTTLAEVQAHQVVVLHTVIVAAVPGSHFRLEY